MKFCAWLCLISLAVLNPAQAKDKIIAPAAQAKSFKADPPSKARPATLSAKPAATNTSAFASVAGDSGGINAAFKQAIVPQNPGNYGAGAADESKSNRDQRLAQMAALYLEYLKASNNYSPSSNVPFTLPDDYYAKRNVVPPGTINLSGTPEWNEQWSKFDACPTTSETELDAQALATAQSMISAGSDALNCTSADKQALKCMMCALKGEAGGETDAGQLAVGNSILTRLFNSRFLPESRGIPPTTCNIIFERPPGGSWQYSYVADGIPDRLPSNVEQLKRLVKNARKTYCIRPGVWTNYWAPGGMKPPGRIPDWADPPSDCPGQTRIDNQIFCRMPGDAIVTRNVADLEAADPSLRGLIPSTPSEAVTPSSGAQ